MNIGRSDGASEKLVAFGGYGTNGYLQSMEVKKHFSEKLEKTSLKIFKHYKLKPSFPIIIKDRAGVGDKPPPPSFVRSINPNFIQKLIRTEMDQFRFDPIWSILIQLDLI